MSKPALNDVKMVRGNVVLKTRYWDGIDRPDFTELEGLSPNQARAWANEINAAADQADEYMAQEAVSKRECLQTEIDNLMKQIARLPPLPTTKTEG